MADTTIGTFYYQAPIIESLSGCTQDGRRTVDCPIDGSIVHLTIRGYSFGNGPPVKVTVGGLPCEPVTITVPHRELVCPLPLGAGTVEVAVERDGLTGSAALLNYASPLITPGTLRRTGQPVVPQGGKAVVTDGPLLGGDSIEFEGSFPSSTCFYVAFSVRSH